MTDEELIEGLKAGDDQAAETAVRTHMPRMLAVARRLLGDSALAEDCVQEAFANMFRKIGAFEGRSSLGTWLYGIVANQALMKLRQQTRRREDPIDDLMPEFDTSACRIEAPWQHLSTPEEILDREKRKDLVIDMINKLPADYRVVLQLRDIEEMSTAEVADALNLTDGNVKVRLHRARSALRSLLEPVLRGEL